MMTFSIRVCSIAYYISGATPGYKVVVSVHVVHDGRSGNCSTWFIRTASRR